MRMTTHHRLLPMLVLAASVAVPACGRTSGEADARDAAASAPAATDRKYLLERVPSILAF